MTTRTQTGPSFGVRAGKLVELEDDAEAEYEIPSAARLVSTHANLIPGQGTVNAPRLFYGARFGNQATPVIDPEAPLVQNLDPEDAEGRSFDEIFGKYAGALRSPVDGTVTRVGGNWVEIDDGVERKRLELYKDFPFNRYTGLNQTPVVQAGAQVRKGDLVAKSNYTDNKGTLALGKNARVAVVPYKGWGLDDSVVISATWAKKLAGEHTITTEQRRDRGVKLGLEHFRSIFPTKFTNDQVAQLDEDGVVKPGSIVRPGDPLILSTRPRSISSASASLGALSKVTRDVRGDASQVWDHETEAVVTDVAKTPKGVKVVTRTIAPTQVGDKVVFRSGQKGTVSAIIPDEQMPRTKDGRAVDVLLNPLGIPSRANNEIIFELALGKLAEKLGKPVKVPSYLPKGTSWHAFVSDQLKQAGVVDKEELFDPTEHRFLDNPVMVGNAYMLKLHHTSEKKAKARSTGSYDANQQPTKGGESGAKRISGLETHGLISAGATATIREGLTVRGQQNDAFWRAIREGNKPMPPGEPFVWSKYRALLAGAGIKARQLGKGRYRLAPMTDKDLEDERPVEIRSGEMVDLKSLEPLEGGLFDPSIMGTNSWGKITLDEPTINPAFEDTVRHLLGYTKKELREVLAGRKEVL